jgi:hypothetical protein
LAVDGCQLEFQLTVSSGTFKFTGMTALWLFVVVALVVALAAWLQSRRTARQLAEVTQMYWQLKYDHGELKAKVDPPEPVAPAPKATFVPLSSIKKS